MTRKVYFISDSTGITTQTLGSSLLAQFQTIAFDKAVKPYIDDAIKAESLVFELNQKHKDDTEKPIFIVSVIKKQLREILLQLNGLTLDVFDSFLLPIQQYIGHTAEERVGQSHLVTNSTSYDRRIEAVNYALDNDDGAHFKDYDKADVILVGVSRSGKTPTCLYLGLQYGIYAANYPLTPDDLDNESLPLALRPYKHKLFGLTISPERLANIREQRRANSRYASLIQCEDEIRLAENLMRKSRINCLNSTTISVEEIATRIIAHMGLERTI